jgi:translation initiation factor 1
VRNPVPDDGVIRVFREKRRASSVTVLHGLPPNEIEATGKELRRLCGTGGTTKNGVVVLQGDHRDAVIAYFTNAGRRVKKAGG